MTMPDPVDVAPRSFAQDVLSAARHYLGNRTGLVVIAASALGLGAYLNWSWLVAAGIAPLLLGVAPCAAMCALGLCMSGRSKTVPDATPNTVEPSKPTIQTNDKHGKGCC